MPMKKEHVKLCKDDDWYKALNRKDKKAKKDPKSINQGYFIAGLIMGTGLGFILAGIGLIIVGVI